MTLSDMLVDLGRFFKYTTSPPSEVTARLTAYLNDTQRELLSIPDLLHLRDMTIAVTAKANMAKTGLPPIVARLNAVIDRGNNRKLFQCTLDEIRLMNPSQTDTGSSPERYAPTGYMEVQYQPEHAGGLWISSTSASDTTQTAYVQSVTTGGYQYADSKALAGLARRQIGATATRTDHVEVTRFYLSAAGVGYVSLWDASAGGNELARLEPGKTFARYQSVEWHPIQSADVTLYADVTRNIPDLVLGTDEPLLPEDFHWVVEWGATQRECLYHNDGRYVTVDREYREGIRDLTSWVMNNGDRITSLRPIVRGRSSLVGMSSQYPADSWRY